MSRRVICLAALMAALAPWLGAQPMDDSMQQAVTAYSAWAEKVAEFTKGIEFDEKDLSTLIEHYAELQSLATADAEDDVTDPAQFDNNMRQVVAEPGYRSWAASNGLDPERWLRTISRISSVYAIVSTERSRAAAEAQRREYEAIVEERCKTSSPETCRAMRESLTAGVAMSEALATAQEKLPPPTAGERALMDRYFDQLTAAMSSAEAPPDAELWNDVEQPGDAEE